MATLVNKFPQGQQEAEQGNLIAICLDRLSDPRPIFRQWLAIALGRVWDKYDTARWRGTRDNAHEKLFENLKDPVRRWKILTCNCSYSFVSGTRSPSRCRLCSRHVSECLRRAERACQQRGPRGCSSAPDRGG